MQFRPFRLYREKHLASLVSNGSVALGGLLSFMLLARQLDAGSFGDWVLFTTLATFTDLLRFGLTRTASVRALAGADEGSRNRVMASSLAIHLLLLGGISALFWGLLGLTRYFEASLQGGYALFLAWYPILALANLSWNNALALFQARQAFGRMMWVRLVQVGSFVLFLGANQWWWHLGLLPIIWAYLLGNFAAGLWCSLRGWDGLSQLRQARRQTADELIRFGKYAMGTLVGSSLLKSADTLIIGLSPVLGSTGIALYAIPAKLIDLLGIPLHSISMAAYPRMARKALEGDRDGARRLFYTYSGLVSLLFLPLAVLGFFLAEPLVLLLGGSGYAEQLPLMVSVFRVFAVYIVLLPLDRFTGVFLDSLNRPHANMHKVLVMTAANIALDLLAVFGFESLVGVALATVLFTLMGIWLGFRALGRELPVGFAPLFAESRAFCLSLKSRLIL